MAILSRRKRVFDETLPDGRSVYEAVRSLSRSPEDEQGVPPEIQRALKLRAEIPLGGGSISGSESIVPVSDLPIIAPRLSLVPDQPSDSDLPILSRAPDLSVAPGVTLPQQSTRPFSVTDIYQTDRTIRPRIDPSIRDPQAQLTDYESNLRAYQPKKEGLGKIAARTALGFVFGGIPGAIGTAGNELLDRRQHDRAWQQNELGRADQQLNTIGSRRREGMQEDLMRSQIEENQATALQRRTAKPVPATVPYGGYDIPPSEAARLAQERDLASNKPAPYRARQTSRRVENGVTYQTEYDPESKKWVKSIGDDGKPVVLEDVKSATGTPPEVIDQNIASIRTQQAKIDAFLNEPANHYITVKDGEPYTDPVTKQVVSPTKQVVNPEWEKSLEERNRLDAEIRDWQGKRKVTRGQRGPAPTTHGFSVSGWLKANKGKTKQDAIADHKANYPDYKIVP